MAITQLLITLSVVLGILLMAVLAVVPLWLEHDGSSEPPRGGMPTHRPRVP